MKKLLFGLAVFTALQLNAQDSEITFTGSGASTSVATVKVENLTSGATLTVNGTDILRLSMMTTGVNSPGEDQPSGLRIYPNPMTDYSILDILSPITGDAVITVSELTGKPVAIENVYLENIRQGFRLTGLKSGFYLVNIRGNGFRYSGKLISNGRASGAIKIEKDYSIFQTVNENIVKTSRNVEATIDMEYANGDLLKFTGASGNYRTIITDIPATSKTINFNFEACTDGENNNYPVVAIGTQVWMAVNLYTRLYNDGTAILNVTSNPAWSTNTTGAYCSYSNTQANSDIYGKLYNWYVVSPTNPKKVCPTGWHVPTDAQWTTLTTYLGGQSVAGGKLKETTTAHWLSPNTGATNETGFGALPGGYRDSSGPFGLIGNSGFWWSSTISGTTYALYRYMYYGSGGLTGSDYDQHTGFYVRCLKD